MADKNKLNIEIGKALKDAENQSTLPKYNLLSALVFPDLLLLNMNLATLKSVCIIL
ncbi:hypothetical protein [Pseudobutyrivibrio sp.]